MYYVYGLYKTPCPQSISDGLYYVGITYDIQLRMKQHGGHYVGKTDNKRKCKIISEYGLHFSILWTTDTEHEAHEREVFLIKYFGRDRYDPHGILTNVVIDTYLPDNTGIIRSEEEVAQYTAWSRQYWSQSDNRQQMRDTKLTYPVDQILSVMNQWLETKPIKLSSFYDFAQPFFPDISPGTMKDWFNKYGQEIRRQVRCNHKSLKQKVLTDYKQFGQQKAASLNSVSVATVRRWRHE